MQKSTLTGSQGGSGISVGGDVAASTAVGVGDICVGMIFVLTGAGVVANSDLAQETSNTNRRRFKIRFITHTLESASLLAILWSLLACRHICKADYFKK